MLLLPLAAKVGLGLATFVLAFALIGGNAWLASRLSRDVEGAGSLFFGEGDAVQLDLPEIVGRAAPPLAAFVSALIGLSGATGALDEVRDGRAVALHRAGEVRSEEPLDTVRGPRRAVDEADPDVGVVISVDEDVPYERVVAILDAVRAAGFERMWFSGGVER